MMKTLEEKLESSQRDVGLILDDIKRRDVKAAIHGLQTVINDLSEMRDDCQKAVDAHERISRQLPAWARRLPNPVSL